MLKATRTRATQRPIETTLLVVSSDPVVIELLVPLLPKEMRWVVATTRSSALETLAGNKAFHGLVLEVPLVDGAGLDLLDPWSAKFPSAPAVVTTRADRDLQVANRAFAKHARFLTMPFGPEEVGVFTSDVQAARWEVPQAIARRFITFVVRHGFTLPQADLWARVVRKVSRPKIAAELGVETSTVRTRETQLCRKVGVTTLDKLYDRMMEP